MRSTAKIITTIVFFIITACQQQGTRLQSVEAGNNTINGSIRTTISTYVAGAEIKIETETNGNEVCVFVITSLTEELICNQVDNPVQTITLPASIAQTAGLIELVLQVDGQPTDDLTITVHAKEAANPLFGLLGPKTISVDSEQKAELIVIATDQYHNLCSDNIPVEITVREPDNQQIKSIRSITNSVAAIYLDHGRKKGIIEVGAQSGNAALRKKEVLLTPGIPGSISIIPVNSALRSGLQQMTEINTNQIRDRYNNMISDGTHVEFVLTDATGRQSIFQSFAVSGKASVQLPHPEIAGRYLLHARIPGYVESEALTLVFEAGLTNFPVTYSPDERFLTIGPVITTIGGLVADGTKVNVSWKEGSLLQSYSVGLVNGLARIPVLKMPGLDESKMCTVEIAAIQKEITW